MLLEILTEIGITGGLATVVEFGLLVCAAKVGVDLYNTATTKK